MFKFYKLIKRFSKKHHERNVSICIEVLKGNTYPVVAKKFNVSTARVSQIFRIGIGQLAMQLYNIDWKEAIFNKKWYRHDDALLWIESYKNQYKNFY